MHEALFPILAQAATRRDAMKHLEVFAARAHRYARERNYVTAHHRNVSQLSAALQHRLISQSEVVQEVLTRHPFAAVEKFLQEVLWRSYWKGWMEMHPGIWTDSQSQLASCSEEQIHRAYAVATGHSGCAVMDDFARELIATGYLHNHARMWWASFWIHQQKLPWVLGARHFMKHLLDADAASNTLSWRWVAGIQTPGKSYLVRCDNIERYHHDPATEGFELLNNIVPHHVIDTATRDATPLPSLPDSVPSSLTNYALLIHEEDLSIETSSLATLRPQAVGFYQQDESPSPARQAWREQAFADAIQRAQTHFQKPCVTLTSTQEIIDWLKRDNISQLVMMHPFVGPLRDALMPLNATAKTHGIEIMFLRRREDTELFPFAQSGFFPFWKKASRWIAR
jgi:deoxyribodipyrimidine photo-lyase